jgi:hypothetical protein
MLPTCYSCGTLTLCLHFNEATCVLQYPSFEVLIDLSQGRLVPVFKNFCVHGVAMIILQKWTCLF